MSCDLYTASALVGFHRCPSKVTSTIVIQMKVINEEKRLGRGVAIFTDLDPNSDSGVIHWYNSERSSISIYSSIATHDFNCFRSNK